MNNRNEMEIWVSDMVSEAHIGFYEQERKVGNRFRIDIKVFYDAARFENENLEATISYVDLVDIARAEMKRGGELLETVACRIAAEIKQRYASISRGEIRIEKCTPPISNFIGHCGVTCYF